jgi:hypothetical protein
MKSGYVLAGFETLATLLYNFQYNTVRDSFDNHFKTEDIANLLSNTCYGFLHGFGQNFTGKKTYDKYVEQEGKLIKKCRDFGYFKDSLFIIDSGGFQASIGKINRDETSNLIKIYHQFLNEKYELFDRAFVLDLPPGPGCKIFKNYGEIEDWNFQTYTLAKNLPDHIRQKMVYIHHFRSPVLWNIFTKILDSDDMFDKFENFSTGGIVANMASDTRIPYILYILPLVPLLRRAKERGRKHFNFHILGGASYRDVFFYELFQLHVKKVHDIDLTFSYDSSGLFKGLMIGRYLNLFDNGLLKKIDLRSNNLNSRFSNKLKVIDVYSEILNTLANKWNLKKIDLKGVYDPMTKTFYDDVKIYSMLYMLDFYSVVQNFLKGASEEIYEFYESGDFGEFVSRLDQVTKILNQGKLSRKHMVKSLSVRRSMDLLTSLDEDNCKDVVMKRLAKDEFSSLEQMDDKLFKI